MENTAAIINVIMYDGEHNGYDDSDFYYVGINIKTGKYFKHVYGSTRWAGKQELPNCVEFGDLAEDEIDGMSKEAIKRMFDAEVERIMLENLEDMTVLEKVRVGDTVKVTNKRAKYYKDLEFVVKEVRDDYFRGRYSRTLLWSDNHVNTATTNVTITKHAEHNLESFRQTIKAGRSIKK